VVNELHVVPRADIIEHSTIGACRCFPRVEDVPDGRLIVHVAADGRL
jgi:hypothetical protein